MAGKLQLNDLVVTIAGKIRGLFAWPVMCAGVDGSGNPQPLLVTSGGIATTPQTVTSTSSIVTGEGSIPIGAKGWTFTVLSGTPTFNGAASLPVGFSDSDINTVKTAIAYDATGGSAYLRIGS